MATFAAACLVWTRIRLDTMSDLIWTRKFETFLVLLIYNKKTKQKNKTKTTALGRDSKIGVCHAIARRFLRLWYKYEVRKFSHFVRFTFRVIKVNQNPTGTNQSHVK